jgi:hypothetical protein
MCKVEELFSLGVWAIKKYELTLMLEVVTKVGWFSVS